MELSFDFDKDKSSLIDEMFYKCDKLCSELLPTGDEVPRFDFANN